MTALVPLTHLAPVARVAVAIEGARRIVTGPAGLTRAPSGTFVNIRVTMFTGISGVAVTSVAEWDFDASAILAWRALAVVNYILTVSPFKAEGTVASV